jgi:ribosomal protein L11 methylase PrmA
VRPSLVWDLGANTGEFSRLAIELGASVVALDRDASCVEVMYRSVSDGGAGRLLPLVADLANPSPAIGWANSERMTLDQRGPADLILALALVHHLAIGNNVPFADVAAYFARLGRRAIVEFVPREDAMAAQMMAGREASFPDYDRGSFERAIAGHFSIAAQATLEGSGRVLYLLDGRSR